MMRFSIVAIVFLLSTAAVAAEKPLPDPPKDLPTATFMVKQGSTELTRRDIVGINVYSIAEQKKYGDISDIIVASDGKTIVAYQISIGGFLGIGTHEVAVPPDGIRIVRDEKFGTLAWINGTKQSVRKAPQYKTLHDQKREAKK